MKNFLHILKGLMINTIIFSLIQLPTIGNSFAQSTSSDPYAGFKAITGQILGAYSSYLGTKQQIIAQQINSANNQKLMAQMGPNCQKADGTSCYTTPAQNFPECTLPASISNMPQNICENPTPETAQISQMMTYEIIAKRWTSYYEQMSNEASNSNAPAGLKCLSDKKKALDSQLTEMVNSLQRLQDQLNKDKQTFRDNNAKILSSLTTNNDELFGAKNNNLNLKTQDFSKLFSSSCQSIIGKDKLKSGTATGLNGFLQDLSSVNKSAADFNQNKNVIQDDINRETNRITASISAGGIDDWLSNRNTQSDIKSTNYPAIEASVKKQAQEFATARARITKQLADVGYTPPAMDKNFSVDLAEFNAGADDFFRKKYVNDCVTGADQGVAIPISDILNSLRQKSTGSQGTATNDYKVALQNILNSNAMMQDKMDQIKALEATYTDITVTYKDASASRITDTPYNLFMKTIAKCSQKYSADPTFSSKGSSGVAYQTKVNRAKAALQELKSLNDNFTSKIASAVNSQVLNCNGAGVKAGGDNCTEDTLKSSSPDFCIDHASTCANQMQGCYAEANQQVATRKAKMDGLAKTFNANVSAMIARSNQLFESQKAAVTNMTKLIQQRFPGTNFVIPANLFVSTPEMKKDTFGVDLMGDGDLKSILDGQDSMPNKIEGLKKIFADQQKTVDASMDNYYALQQNAMKENAGKWAALSSKCTDAIKTSQKSLADANAQGQAAQAKQDAQVAKFCKKYNSISQNPIGACGKARDLADTTDEISARLTGKAESVTQQYANACDGYMNQSDDLSKAQDCSDLKGTAKKDCEAINHRIATGGTSTKKKSKKSVNLKSLCGSDVNATDKDFFSNLSNQLSDSDKDKLSSVDNLSDALKKSDDLDDNGFLSNIADIVPDKSKGICNQINKSITPPADYDEVENTKKIDDALTALNKKDITDADRKVQNIVLTDANKAKKAADKAKQTSDQIDRLMADLDEVKNPAPLSKDEQAVKLVQDIGEQATGPCDMQASNTNVNKMFQFDLNNHDQSVLGSSGRSQ